MKDDELFKFAEKTMGECLATMKKKNHDYATAAGDKDCDALKNFKLVEYLNISDVQTGILVRLCDKISRLANTYHGGSKIKDESCYDTGKDLINYTIILLALLNVEEGKNGSK